jgi:hypothetical protein
MRPFIVAFIIALMISCWLNDVGYKPSGWPVSIKDAEENNTFGTKREGYMIPETVVVDTPRPIWVFGKVDDGEEGRRGEFPYGLPY